MATLFSIGFIGFCLSLFGAVASFFLALVFLSIGILTFSFFHFIRRKGLLQFLPAAIQKLFTEISIFDILVDVIIYHKISTMILAVVKPFASSSTPGEAKEKLKNEGLISARVYKAIFKKGIMNNFPDKVKVLMLPEIEETINGPLIDAATAKTDPLRRSRTHSSNRLLPITTQDEFDEKYGGNAISKKKKINSGVPTLANESKFNRAEEKKNQLDSSNGTTG